MEHLSGQGLSHVTWPWWSKCSDTKFGGNVLSGPNSKHRLETTVDRPLARAFSKGGVTEGGGFHTRVKGTMFVRDGAVTPGPSRECDITFFVKGRPKSAQQSRDSTVAARSVQSVTVPSSRVSRECRSPGLRSPPFKNARLANRDLTAIAISDSNRNAQITIKGR